MACISVRYERKMHVLIIQKYRKYMLYKDFYTEIFQIYGVAVS